MEDSTKFLKDLIMDTNHRPFHYDAAARAFILGEQTLPIDDITLKSLANYIDQPQLLSGEAADHIISTESLIIGPWLHHPIVLPTLNDALAAGLLTPGLIEETLNAMADVYEATADPRDQAVKRMLRIPSTDGGMRQVGGAMSGLSIMLQTSQGNPQLSLTAPGICACLQIDPYGIVVDQVGEDARISEYNWHNIERPAQEYSIFAGLGHIGLRAKQLTA